MLTGRRPGRRGETQDKMVLSASMMSSRAAVAAVVLLLAGAPFIAVQAQERTELAMIQKSAADLAQRIQAELATKPAGTSAEDYEGFIVFVIGQADYAPEAVLSALNMVDGTATSQPIRQAIANVRANLLRRKLQRGTAAIRSGFGSFDLPPSGASGPDGSINYSPNN